MRMYFHLRLLRSIAMGDIKVVIYYNMQMRLLANYDNHI
jgi:hypothetical protein